MAAVTSPSLPNAAAPEMVVAPSQGIDPDDLATALRVLAQLPELDPGHPDIQTVKRASSRMYKQIRKHRRHLHTVRQ